MLTGCVGVQVQLLVRMASGSIGGWRSTDLSGGIGETEFEADPSTPSLLWFRDETAVTSGSVDGVARILRLRSGGR